MVSDCASCATRTYLRSDRNAPFAPSEEKPVRWRSYRLRLEKVAARRGEIDFMPVEAATAVGTLEITVDKFELLRELTTTQGVVERNLSVNTLWTLCNVDDKFWPLLPESCQ